MSFLSPLSNPTRAYSITPSPTEDIPPLQSPTHDLPELPPIDYEARTALPPKPAEVNSTDNRKSQSDSSSLFCASCSRKDFCCFSHLNMKCRTTYVITGTPGTCWTSAEHHQYLASFSCMRKHVMWNGVFASGSPQVLVHGSSCRNVCINSPSILVLCQKQLRSRQGRAVEVCQLWQSCSSTQLRMCWVCWCAETDSHWFYMHAFVQIFYLFTIVSRHSACIRLYTTL